MSTALRPVSSQPTRFVGRVADLAALRDAFTRGARLVTLLGPPGIGKSRLALRHAELTLGDGLHPGGVVVCDLAETSTEGELVAALGRALGVLHGPSVHDSDRVAEVGARLEALGDALVVLDDFERLVPSAPDTVGRWLRLAPRLRFLVTSRSRLDLTGETVHPLAPLALPDDGRPAESSEAVQLFLDRARAVRPDFALTPDMAPTVAAIVRELDGIPLALELGGSRMGILSPTQLLERLPRRLDVLSTRVRDGRARQRTLRDAIDASFRLLAPWEQAALAQVSVFRGGFDLEAAEAVVDLGAFRDAPPLLDVLESLVGRSLLFTRAPQGDPFALRFGLYHAIRDFAAERLAAGFDLAAVEERHARYFLALARTFGDVRDAPPTAEAERRLPIEQENLLAAHRHLCAGSSASPGALQITLALEEPLTRWGPVPLLLSLVDAALAAGGDVPPSLRARGLAARASALRLHGRLHDSAEAYIRALVELGPRDVRAGGVVCVELGIVLREQGRLEEAAQRLTDALDLLQSIGDLRWQARALITLGHVDTAGGRTSKARAELEQALALAREAKDPEYEFVARVSLGQLDLYEGHLEEADAQLDAAGAVAGQHALTNEIPYHFIRGRVRLEQGMFAEARAALEASVSIARKLGNDRQEGFSLGGLGLLFGEMGDLSAARATLERGLALVRKAGDRRAESLFTVALAAILARLGDLPEAERLLGPVDDLLDAFGDAQLRAIVDVYRQGLALERAARAGDDALREAARRAHRAMGILRGEGGPRDQAPVSRSHHARDALRVVSRIFADRLAEPHASRGASVAPIDSPPSSAVADRKARPVLVVSPDGRHVRLPDGREIVFQRGKSLRLMLLRLFEERLAAPGRALSIPALFACGWPGERASTEAIENRVYVGISRLRKLGFQGLLQSRDDGFLLDPSVPAYRAEKPI
ncbi:ATP-binding protein [Polyangium aurulentum]|uniref:ATP-binding protein n=1 Tax=Polyangium aurulentum TaxID=2567896 RepID=UPI0010AECAD9|nr:tetratricopeptide repeat protein [Polyangium aurulentum]UQA56337.1 tetratricopeptide repeat protein [Polyangium aurulentum]